MIRREPKKPVAVSCNGCAITHRNNLRDWKAFAYKHAWAAAKADGWIAKKHENGIDWKHYCKDCATPQ